jgi:hypothetical protein
MNSKQQCYSSDRTKRVSEATSDNLLDQSKAKKRQQEQHCRSHKNLERGTANKNIVRIIDHIKLEISESSVQGSWVVM